VAWALPLQLYYKARQVNKAACEVDRKIQENVLIHSLSARIEEKRCSCMGLVAGGGGIGFFFVCNFLQSSLENRRIELKKEWDVSYLPLIYAK
jgi:hypothetical protein